MPLDIVQNEADTYRGLYRPRHPLTWVQRVGAVLIGLIFVAPAIVTTIGFSRDGFSAEDLQGGGPIGLLFLLFVMLALAALAYFGGRLVWNGLTGGKNVQSQHRC